MAYITGLWLGGGEHTLFPQRERKLSAGHRNDVERHEQTQILGMITMLQEKSMSKIFRGEAVVTVVYLLNRCTTEGVHTLTPQKKYFGTKSNLSRFKVFGCIAYLHILDEERSKLDPK